MAASAGFFGGDGMGNRGGVQGAAADHGAYLAWRGRWAAAAWMVVLAIAMNLLPDAVHRPPRGIWLQEWDAHIIKPMSGQIGQWFVDVTMNQSIAGAAQTILRRTGLFQVGS